MILEERPDGAGTGEKSARLQGHDSLTQTQRGQLQSRRAWIYQQIDKELQMRTGAENLYSEAVTVPMIPLGLKETKELDWSTPLKELISVHFGEDGTSYEAEIRELEALRQAMRTPSRNEAGLELLTTYYHQLCLLDARFLTPARSLGLFFQCLTPHCRYDSLTGVPAQQRALAFEKGSVLFNIGALHTQIGARQDRTCVEGVHCAVEAFQRAAGAFSLLRENFSHAPSPDMNAASLCALEQLMMAQAQECVFEGLLPPASMAPCDCLAQLHLAQEAAQVAAEYRLVHRTMAQPPVHDYVPASWITLVHVKAEYFCSLAHYHIAMALCDSSPATEGELPAHEQVFLQPHASSEPRGPALPLELEERRKLGKAHLKRAILGQEEALRLHTLCRVLREVDLLRAVVAQALQRSLAKYSELDCEDDFCETAEAPDIRPKTRQKPEARMPHLSQGKGPDIFHRLGPLSVFSAKNRWRLVGPIHLTRGEGGFGLTLRGDSPVLIAAVIPGGQAAAAGLKEGDYIVAVNGQPCRWWRHAEVVAELRASGDAGASLQVVSLLPSSGLPCLGDRRPALLGPKGLLRSQREHGCKTPASTRASPRPLLGWSRKTQQGKTGGCSQPGAPAKTAPPSPSELPGQL
ncbi:rhophilin-1 isoform X5 [Cebus imitator]|uniref:rhophilin-1 isoform X5 n=1 Tax=Cebus imitator TaxID=2715852 RepID=UPI00189A64DB|nr:rhophilin-1 isoform X5 [Cebus imitator]